jgi:hypothetical protein
MRKEDRIIYGKEMLQSFFRFTGTIGELHGRVVTLVMDAGELDNSLCAVQVTARIESIAIIIRGAVEIGLSVQSINGYAIRCVTIHASNNGTLSYHHTGEDLKATRIIEARLE